MSQRKSETARLNGSKSHGPKTPDGKTRSPQNAPRHGLTANFTVQLDESQEEFETFLDAYVHRFQPADAVELDLVQTMAIARWRLRRIATLEGALFENKLMLSEEPIAEEFEDLDGANRLAWVFDKLAEESKALTLLMRYETSQNRLYERAAKQLAGLQSTGPRNEPTERLNPDPPRTSRTSLEDSSTEVESVTHPSAVVSLPERRQDVSTRSMTVAPQPGSSPEARQ
jgi:hypothetical protein